MEIDEGTEDRQVQVCFVTKLQDIPFKVPNTTIPASYSRLDLSKVVNALIQTENPEWESEPFDFLINGVLVRMSLGQFLLAKGISAEKKLEIEYIRAIVPRKEEEPCLHNDWVSAVDGSSPGFILTGCYDGLRSRINSEGELSRQAWIQNMDITSRINSEGELSRQAWIQNMQVIKESFKEVVSDSIAANARATEANARLVAEMCSNAKKEIAEMLKNYQPERVSSMASASNPAPRNDV